MELKLANSTMNGALDAQAEVESEMFKLRKEQENLYSDLLKATAVKSILCGQRDRAIKILERWNNWAQGIAFTAPKEDVMLVSDTMDIINDIDPAVEPTINCTNNKPKLTMKEIAQRIAVHLKRFENDPEINKKRDGMRTFPYYNAGAYYPGGPKIGVTYISFQGTSNLSKTEAIKYLEWLDAGNVGKHYEVLRGK